MSEHVRRALEDLLRHYVGVVSSGDCGNWDPEREEVVIAARAALRVTDSGSPDEARCLRVFFALMRDRADPVGQNHAGSQVAQEFRVAGYRSGLLMGSDVDRLPYHPAMHPLTRVGVAAYHAGRAVVASEQARRAADEAMRQMARGGES